MSRPVQPVRTIDAASLHDIALGATILGTGGGGDPTIGRLMAARAIAECGPVTLVAPETVPEDARIFLVGMMGAPAVIVEKLPSGEEPVIAVRALERHLGQAITHIGCLEAGGINAMIPIAAAARTGLPLIDADGMGRAFPELQMLLPTLDGIRATPMVLVDEKDNAALIDALDNPTAERFARALTVEMGASATMAFYPLTGSDVQRSLVPHTYDLAWRLGAALRRARLGHGDVVSSLAHDLGGRRLFAGKIVDVTRRTTAGFTRGEARFAGSGDFAGQELLLEFQNEFLVATHNGQAVCTTPDLICVVDAETGEPVTAEALRYGQRLAVLGAPCFPRWRSAAGLALVGPRYFGYDIDYRPFGEDREDAA